MRRMLAPLLFLACAAPALADLEQDRALCADKTAPADARALACEGALASDALSPAERLDAQWDLAESLMDLERYAEAIAAYDGAIALAPEKVALYRRRGTAKTYVKDYPGALADFDAAIVLDPLDEWVHYARGFTLERLNRPEEAMAAYEASLALEPDFISAIDAKGRLHLKQKQYAQAVAAFDGLLALEPYEPMHSLLRGQAHLGLEDEGAALRDFRVAHLLDPNIGADYRIEALLPDGLPPPVEGPLYAPSQSGLAIDFLQVVTTLPPEVDEMEAAIGELAAWFSKPEQPLPTMANFVRREVLTQEGDRAAVRNSLLFPAWDQAEVGWSEQLGDQYFGIWPGALGAREAGPALAIAYDRGALVRLWQQPVGEAMQGRAKIELVCPGPDEAPNPIAIGVGCGEGLQRVPLGSMTWSGRIVGWESVLVPAGVFSTVRVEATLEAKLQLFGGTLEETIAFTWWFDPTLGFWVKRLQRQGGEEEVLIAEAVTIARP